MGKGVRQAGPGAREDGQQGRWMGVGGRSRRAAVEVAQGWRVGTSGSTEQMALIF